MASLPIKITAAGYAALRNAQGNGTNAVLVATAGLTSTAFTPGDAVPQEIKRVATIAGGATSPNTIHVTISDASADAYTCRGFGLYLDNGTLLGSYGQADVIVEKSSQAAMLLAIDIQFADIDATQITFGDTNFSNPQATTERVGVVELATDTETIAGTDAARVITPKGLLAALNDRLGAGAPSAFVKTLLTKATVLAFVTALGIRSAAQYDTGAGNGLDADKLDGNDGAYYLDWNNLQNVPGTFKPAPHQHAASDITSGIFPVPRGGTGLATVPAGYFLAGAANGTDAMVPRSPDQVRIDIQAAASSHSHIIANVTGLQDALDGKAAKVHTHVIGDVTSLQSTLDAKAPVANPAFTGVVSNQAGALQAGAGSGLETWSTRAQDGNADAIRTALWRATSNGGWSNCYWRMERIVDVSGQGWYDLGANSTGVGFLHRWGYQGNTHAYVDLNGNFNFQGTTAHLGATFSGADITFTNGAPLRFTGMGASGGMYWHGLNGAGDDILMIQRQGTNSSYVLNWNGIINASQWFNYSDRRLKFNIKRKAVTRGLALHIAKGYSSWQMKADGSYGEGAIAQHVQKKAPHHVDETETKSSAKRARSKKRLTVNNLGMAVEMGADNALHIQELEGFIAKLAKRVEKLEARK
jgi:hypothetical protein